jgi:hypothetical protein
MEPCGSVVSWGVIKLVVVLTSLEYSRAEVDREVVFGRLVMLVMTYGFELTKLELKVIKEYFKHWDNLSNCAKGVPFKALSSSFERSEDLNIVGHHRPVMAEEPVGSHPWLRVGPLVVPARSVRVLILDPIYMEAGVGVNGWL